MADLALEVGVVIDPVQKEEEDDGIKQNVTAWHGYGQVCT